VRATERVSESDIERKRTKESTTKLERMKANEKEIQR
jgi:hypothetical protein